jgi:ketosteroid isomerase-like protein
MKLTKLKLKQLIKEIAEEELEIDSFEGADPEWGAPAAKEQWATDMEKIMEKAVRLYEKMPLEGKEAFTEEFEKYAKHWRYKMREETDDTPSWMEDDEDVGDDI